MLPRTFHFFLFAFFYFITSLSAFSQDDLEKQISIQEFKIIGNKTTKENIVLREIPVKIGDTILVGQLVDLLNRTKSNLLNTSLFNFVDVSPVYFDDNHISIYITLEERWYWWPAPIFEVEENNINTWWRNRNSGRVNYGLHLSKNNFRGRKENITFFFQGGYTEKFRVNYTVPYINKRKTNGLSFNFSYSRNHEITYATDENVLQFYRQERDYIKKEISSTIGYELRPKLYNKHNFYLEYRDIEVSDSISLLNNNFLLNGKNRMNFFHLNYVWKRDKRDNKNYPLRGYYYDFNLNKEGLGILKGAPNALYFTSHLKKFWVLLNRLYFSGSLKGKTTINEGPYILYNGLGFRNNIVRGYERYVINGEHYGLMKMQLRYAVLKEKVFNINPMPAKKFNKVPLSIYIGSFFDAGYVDSKINTRNNNLVNTTLYGGGISIDFVSYYDMVLRVEYSMNKIKDKGLFFHFVAPI